MSNHSLHKAGEMPRDERLLVERWLGRVLSDHDIIGVNVYWPHPAPVGTELAALRREIVAHAQEIALKVLPRMTWTRWSTRRSHRIPADAFEIHARFQHPCPRRGQPARTGVARPGHRPRRIP